MSAADSSRTRRVYRTPRGLVSVAGLTLLAAVLIAARASILQQGNPSGELLVGSYHFTTEGSTTYTQRQPNQTNIHSDTETSEWNLRFYNGGRALMMKTNGRSYNRVMTDTIEYPSGGLERVIKTEKYWRAGDYPDQAGNLQRVARPRPLRGYYRALVISNDPLIQVWHQTTVEKQFRGARPTTISYPEQLLMLHASLEVGWEQAQWADDYNGRIEALNRARQYTDPNGKRWLNIKADWQLQPAR